MRIIEILEPFIFADVYEEKRFKTRKDSFEYMARYYDNPNEEEFTTVQTETYAYLIVYKMNNLIPFLIMLLFGVVAPSILMVMHLIIVSVAFAISSLIFFLYCMWNLSRIEKSKQITNYFKGEYEKLEKQNTKYAFLFLMIFIFSLCLTRI